jgi:hypothetical protein
MGVGVVEALGLTERKITYGTTATFALLALTSEKPRVWKLTHCAACAAGAR